jgi:hypothetical protein
MSRTQGVAFMLFRFHGVPSAAAFCCVLLSMTGCGGGGGGDGPEPAPTVSLSANPTILNEGEQSQLTWSTTNAFDCTASGGWSGSRGTSGTATTPALSTTITFNLSCTGPGGSAQAAITVTVRPLPVVSLTASPSIVRTGVTSTLSWTATNATTCDASNGWSGTRATTGTEIVGPFTQNAFFVLNCMGDGGIGAANVTVRFRAGVNTPPTANAGPDKTVFSTTTVQLEGQNSTDAGGAIALASWTQTSGPAVTLTNASSLQPTFVAPTVATDTVLTFSMTVTDDEGLVSAPDTVNVTVQPIPPNVTVQGFVLFEKVPFKPQLGGGLNYPSMFLSPVRAEVLVEAIDAATQAVLASGRFGGSGFQLTVPSQRDIQLRATAETSRQAPLPLPHWQIRVRDLDPESGAPLGPVYTYTGPTFNTGASVSRNLEIPSGFNQVGQVVGPRHAAPFAILDSLHVGLQRVLQVAPTADFPSLIIDWGPANAGGVTFFTRLGADRLIVLAAEPNVDTDEYDVSVILHEFGHYVSDSFSRDDNLGGSHALGDRLDMRVAFSEGLATTFAQIALGNSTYRDSFGTAQQSDSFFNLEDDRTINEGWYAESSTQEVLWDLFDSNSDTNDNVSLGFQPIWDVLVGPNRQTDAMVSVFPFFTAYRQQQSAQAAAIDALLLNEQIVGPTIDIYGSTETNNAGSSDVLPIYSNIALGGSMLLRSTNQFGTLNKLSSHRYLRFSLPAQTNVRFVVTAAAGRDPDVTIYRRGVSLGPPQGPANEDFVMNLLAGDYVLDLFDCGNAGCNDTVPSAPTDITISVTPN